MTEFKDWREKYLWLQERGVRFQARGGERWFQIEPCTFNLPQDNYRIAPYDVAKAEALLAGHGTAIQQSEQDTCWCRRCREQDVLHIASTMILCPLCGNKRCPHATDHNLDCTNSNEPGQVGSSYGPSLLEEITLLRAENESLRKAMKDIIDYSDNPGDPDYLHWEEKFDALRAALDAAMKEKP